MLNLVQAEGAATFAGLERALDAGLVDKVGFTGSSAVGAKIGELCGRHLQSPCLELGGKNPLVVMDDADLDLAVEGALFSGFGTAGQRCTSLGLAVVHEDVHDEFVKRLDERTRAAAIGDPTEDVLYGPMLHERFADRFEEWLGLIEDHHEVLGSSATGRIGGDSPRDGFVGDAEAGLFYHPTIVTGVTHDDALATTETFGPIVPVAKFSTWDEAIALANDHGYGLSSAIYTNNPKHALRFRQQVSAGMLSVNNSTSGAEAHLPFGGNGKSGNGSRQSGMWVLDQFTRWQSMNWDYAGKLQKAQMDVVEIDADADFRLEDGSDALAYATHEQARQVRHVPAGAPPLQPGQDLRPDRRRAARRSRRSRSSSRHAGRARSRASRPRAARSSTVWRPPSRSSRSSFQVTASVRCSRGRCQSSVWLPSPSPPCPHMVRSSNESRASPSP